MYIGQCVKLSFKISGIEKKKKIQNTGILFENKYTDQCQVAIGLKHASTLKKTDSIVIIWELVTNAECQAIVPILLNQNIIFSKIPK